MPPKCEHKITIFVGGQGRCTKCAALLNGAFQAAAWICKSCENVNEKETSWCLHCRTSRYPNIVSPKLQDRLTALGYTVDDFDRAVAHIGSLLCGQTVTADTLAFAFIALKFQVGTTVNIPIAVDQFMGEAKIARNEDHIQRCGVWMRSFHRALEGRREDRSATRDAIRDQLIELLGGADALIFQTHRIMRNRLTEASCMPRLDKNKENKIEDLVAAGVLSPIRRKVIVKAQRPNASIPP